MTPTERIGQLEAENARWRQLFAGWLLVAGGIVLLASYFLPWSSGAQVPGRDICPTCTPKVFAHTAWPLINPAAVYWENTVRDLTHGNASFLLVYTLAPAHARNADAVALAGAGHTLLCARTADCVGTAGHHDVGQSHIPLPNHRLLPGVRSRHGLLRRWPPHATHQAAVASACGRGHLVTERSTACCSSLSLSNLRLNTCLIGTRNHACSRMRANA